MRSMTYLAAGSRHALHDLLQQQFDLSADVVGDLRDAVLDALPGVVTASREADRVVLLSSEPEATTRELLRLDARLSDLEIAGAALEEAFLALTGSTNTTEAT